MSEEKKCKGFWNMCGCDICRKRDNKLEEDLNAERVSREEAFAELKRDRGIEDYKP